MIRVFQEKGDAENGKLTVTFHSKYNFYQILHAVKKFPAKRIKRNWKLNVEDIYDLLEELSKIKKETTHVDFGIFSYFFAFNKYRKSLIDLRSQLEGIDCGVELIPPNKLLPFQHVGVEFIKTVKNGLIADKVGLGKTVQGFSAAKALYETAEIEKAFVVVTSSLKKKWERDIRLLGGMESVILEAPRDQRQKIYEDWMNGDKIFLILSYDTLRIDWERYIQNFLPKPFCVIFDEVQKMKNKRTLRSEACKALASHMYCTSRIGLSATYIETGLQDMFGSMYVINENIFGQNYMSFAEKYLDIDFMGKVVGGTPEGIKLARKKMKMCSVRRRKPQVKDQLNAFLPKVNESTLWLELTKHQKVLYNQVLKGVIEKIQDMEKAQQVSMTTALTVIGLLQQVCLSTELFDYEHKSSVKIDTLLDMLPEIIEENKVLIFCRYVKFIDIMEREFLKNGIKCMAMHGSRKEGKMKNRQDTIDEFSDSEDCNVLIASDILAEGVDVPAASYVINTDILWNPAKMTQRAGRIDRLNQKADNLYIINLLAGNGSIDEEMFQVVYERYNLALEVMDDGVEETRIKKVTFSDIKKMLRRVI